MIFIAYPFGLGVWMALTDKMVGKPGNFVGLANFARLFKSQIFWTTAWNTVFFTVVATVLKAILGMCLALLLNRKFRLSRVTRATVLLPFIVPTVLSGLAWLWMFDATFSVINWGLRWLWQMEVSVFGTAPQRQLGLFSRPTMAWRSRLGHGLHYHCQYLARHSVFCHLLSGRPANRAARAL